MVFLWIQHCFSHIIWNILSYNCMEIVFLLKHIWYILAWKPHIFIWWWSHVNTVIQVDFVHLINVVTVFISHGIPDKNRWMCVKNNTIMQYFFEFIGCFSPKTMYTVRLGLIFHVVLIGEIRTNNMVYFLRPKNVIIDGFCWYMWKNKIFKKLCSFEIYFSAKQYRFPLEIRDLVFEGNLVFVYFSYKLYVVFHYIYHDFAIIFAG